MPNDHDDEQQPQIPDAEGVAVPDLRSLLIGPPFALFGDCKQLPDDKARHIQSVSCIKCRCGHAFKVDLLSDTPKACPGCKATYTHILVVCRADDSEMWDDLALQILHANGITPPEEEDDAEADDDDADDDDDDDDDDDSQGEDDAEPGEDE
jgi:hypothetical protein